MNRAATIGLTILLSAPALLFLGAVLGWLSRDREDNAELDEMRKACERARATCLEADAILAAIQQDPPPRTHRQRYLLLCPKCGQVELATDLVDPVPVTPLEMKAALDVIMTEHAIAAHLDEVA